jgi:hypothetical protein
VKAFQCVECGTLTESANAMCRARGHKVTNVATIKRFFECTKCERRDSLLGGGHGKPSYGCTFCNNTSWRPCGKNKSGFGMSSKIGASEKLVVSMSEHTSRTDINRISADKSSLDYTAK